MKQRKTYVPAIDISTAKKTACESFSGPPVLKNRMGNGRPETCTTDKNRKKPCLSAGADSSMEKNRRVEQKGGFTRFHVSGASYRMQMQGAGFSVCPIISRKQVCRRRFCIDLIQESGWVDTGRQNRSCMLTVQTEF